MFMFFALPAAFVYGTVLHPPLARRWRAMRGNVAPTHA